LSARFSHAFSIRLKRALFCGVAAGVAKTRRLLQRRTFEEAVHTILDDVIALLGAEYGNVQLSIGDELVIAAQRGLFADFLKTFRRVKKDEGSACARALRLGKTVIIRDVENDPEFAAFRADAKKAGFRSVQSTPFFTKDGNVLGMVSTHFAHVHEPTSIEMQTLKAYAIVAAEHLNKLLGDVPLANKTEQMSEELYAQTLGHKGVEAESRSSSASTSH
jgi:transcriptional regulator with GAF, ATPase, and Fis domain